MMQEALTFDDVLLVPKYSDIESRKEIDIGGMLYSPNHGGVRGGIRLNFPIVSSPMDTVTEHLMAETMAENGGLGIVHRYNTIEQQMATINKMKDCHVGAAIGVTGDFLERAQELINNRVNVICIDVAHGDHILMKKAIEAVRKLDPAIHIMAGNVATGEAFVRLAQWGADSIRVGIGGGSICSTRINTGFGVPNLAVIFDCMTKWKEYNVVFKECGDGFTRPVSGNFQKPTLIVDGGIKTAGDIVKALAAGADFVMCGSLLAGTAESPGEVLMNDDGRQVKVFRGMASREAQTNFKGTSSAPEGISTTIPFKGSVVPILQDLAGNIRSGFSYAGARNIEELRRNAHFIKQTHAGQHESFTHILSKR